MACNLGPNNMVMTVRERLYNNGYYYMEMKKEEYKKHLDGLTFIEVIE